MVFENSCGDSKQNVCFLVLFGTSKQQKDSWADYGASEVSSSEVDGLTVVVQKVMGLYRSRENCPDAVAT